MAIEPPLSISFRCFSKIWNGAVFAGPALQVWRSGHEETGGLPFEGLHDHPSYVIFEWLKTLLQWLSDPIDVVWYFNGFMNCSMINLDLQLFDVESYRRPIHVSTHEWVAATAIRVAPIWHPHRAINRVMKRLVSKTCKHTSEKHGNHMYTWGVP